jgi:hypothetical protein
MDVVFYDELGRRRGFWRVDLDLHDFARLQRPFSVVDARPGPLALDGVRPGVQPMAPFGDGLVVEEQIDVRGRRGAVHDHLGHLLLQRGGFVFGRGGEDGIAGGLGDLRKLPGRGDHLPASAFADGDVQAQGVIPAGDRDLAVDGERVGEVSGGFEAKTKLSLALVRTCGERERSQDHRSDLRAGVAHGPISSVRSGIISMTFLRTKGLLSAVSRSACRKRMRVSFCFQIRPSCGLPSGPWMMVQSFSFCSWVVFHIV